MFGKLFQMTSRSYCMWRIKWTISIHFGSDLSEPTACPKSVSFVVVCCHISNSCGYSFARRLRPVQVTSCGYSFAWRLRPVQVTSLVDTALPEGWGPSKLPLLWIQLCPKVEAHPSYLLWIQLCPKVEAHPSYLSLKFSCVPHCSHSKMLFQL